MKKVESLFLLVLSLIFMVAYTITPVPPVSPPPSGAITTECPEPTFGRSFTFQETNLKSGKVVATFTWSFEKQDSYNGKPALWIRVVGSQSEEIYQIWDLNFNYLATLKQGQKTQAASPCFKLYDWPLYVGKRWICLYDFWDRGQRLKGVIKDAVVEKYQQIKVPAGTFQTFQIKISDKFDWAIHYYSPELKMTVKTEVTREAGHPHGAGKWIQELIAYNLPKEGDLR